MKLKRPERFSRWEFFIGDKEEYRVPREGYARNKKALIIQVLSYAQNLQSQGAGDYHSKIKEEAAAFKQDAEFYLSMLIEHQICVRASNQGKEGLCWSSGLGDTIHSTISTIEKKALKVLPQSAQKVYRSVVNKIMPGSGGKVSGCRKCGGSKSLSLNQSNNAGRVNKLNK